MKRQKTKHRIPVEVPLSNDGSISDVINDFINTMEKVTGGNVELECDLQGHITIYYGDSPAPSIKNKNKLQFPERHVEYRSNFDALSEGEAKESDMSVEPEITIF